MNTVKKILKRNIVLLACVAILGLHGVLPIAANAQWGGYLGSCPAGHQPQNFKEFICVAVSITELLSVYAASCALLAFIWGLAKFIFNAGNEEKIAEGKMIMKWGLVGLFFMSSIWGVMQLLTNGLGLTLGLPLLPQ